MELGSLTRAIFLGQKNKSLKKALAGVFLLLSYSLQAAPISVNNLSWSGDSTDTIIQDSLNDREWLRWDVLADLNYSETLSALGSGSAYEGWKVATEADAFLFVDALTQPVFNACSSAPSDAFATQTCREWDWYTSHDGLGVLAELMGNDQQDGLFMGSSAFFLSDPLSTNPFNLPDEEVGLLSVSDYFSNFSPAFDYSKIDMIREWDSIAYSNNYSVTDSFGWCPTVCPRTSWMIYREVPIPEPAPLTLLASGFAAIVFIRRYAR